MIKLKLGANKDRVPTGDSSQNQIPAAPPQQNNAASPATPSTATSGGGFKLKLNVSQPPTPVEQTPQGGFPSTSEQSDKKKKAAKPKQDGPGKGKKRAANDDTISPAAKRVASGAGTNPSRKLSLKLGPQNAPSADGPKPKIAFGKKKQSVPRLVDIRARGKAPPRQKGVGYDSEDSDVEEDPAIQQAFVLRMEEGEDANFLKEAIATGRIGPHPSQGDAEVSIRFLEKNYRRAVVKIQGRMYGAVLVDLPCIVESMKSFDKKGWWKVADIAQMLLVLGRCNSEEEAKSLPLPREVNKENMQYAHGLTPPMHWVRKRRFRKRVSYNDKLSVEEEVARLLAADKECEDAGGTVDIDSHARQEQEQSMEPHDEYSADEDDAEGAIETVERDGHDYDMEDAEGEYEDEADADQLAAALQAGFDEDTEVTVAPTLDTSTSALNSESSAPRIADQPTVETPVAMEPESEAPTPAANDEEEDEDEEAESSDEDEDDDELDVMDEDAAAKAAERAQQMEEVADLEREIERARQKVTAMTNQLLRQRETTKLHALEEDLRVKKSIMGLDQED